MSEFDKYIVQGEPSKKAKASAWQTAIGLQDVDGLKPDVVHWFLDDATNVRSSFYLEDVATEFDVQGLELDWSCVVWDGDFRYTPDGWSHHSFCGDKWQSINKPERKAFQKNAYRVLLTRARQGMVLVVPEGNPEDPTRSPAYYDSTYEYLKEIGIKEI